VHAVRDTRALGPAARRIVAVVVVHEGEARGCGHVGQRLDQVAHALVRIRGAADAQDHVGLARPGRIGPEQLGVDAVGDHAELAPRDAEVALEGARRDRGRREDAVEAPRDGRLHADGIELHRAERFAQRAVAMEGGAPVDRERVVHRADDGQAHAQQRQQAPAEALHVVHEVVARAAADARGERAQRAHAEREGLGQEAHARRRQLVEVERREHPAQRARQHLRAVAVEPAGPVLRVRQPLDLGEGHRVGVGRADQHVDGVAEARQLARQEPEVHPLAAAVHVAAVGDEGDAQRPRAGAHARGPRAGSSGFSA
jgi:hypothetical protein